MWGNPKNGRWNVEKPFVLSNVEACPEPAEGHERLFCFTH
jgi:hypothetical protein